MSKMMCTLKMLRKAIALIMMLFLFGLTAYVNFCSNTLAYFLCWIVSCLSESKVYAGVKAD